MSMSAFVPHDRGRARQGFTLLELIIVLVVLAALAALVVPTLGFVRDQAKYATGAAGAAEVLNNLETYKAATGSYPQRMDTLVDTSGSYYSKAYTTSSGAFPFGNVVPGSTNNLAYMLWNGGGMTDFVYHDPSDDVLPNNSTESSPVQTISYATMSSMQFAVVDPERTGVSASYDTWLFEIIRTCYPNQQDAENPTIPTGHSLVALGVGSRASCVGSTMTSAPVWGGGSSEKYSRYIALFDVSEGGTGRGAVKLKAVVDSEFQTIAANVSNYKRSGPTDDEGLIPPPEEEEETP